MVILFAERALQIGQYNLNGLLNYLKEYYKDPDVSQRALEYLRRIRVRFFREKYLKPHFGNVSWEGEL